MRIKYLLLIIIFLSIISCSNNKPDWSVTNEALYKMLIIYQDTVSDNFKKNIANYLLTNSVNISTTLSFEYLVENIDDACYYRSKSKWGDKIDFNIFCEYALPPQLDNEQPENWRKLANECFDDSLYLIDDPIHACSALHKQIYNKLSSQVEFELSAFYPNATFSELIAKEQMSCATLTRLGLFTFRAFNIPVTKDFTPHWGNHPHRHFWSAVLIDSACFVPFDVTYRPKNFKIKWWAKVSKVYRETFTQSEYSHVYTQGVKNYLPMFFNNPYLIDVTDEYVNTSDVKIPILNKIKSDVFFLSVFDIFGWESVAFGMRAGHTAHFTKVTDSIIFLPLSISAQEQIPINFPFITIKGVKHVYKPNYNCSESIILSRKYKIMPHISLYLGRSYNGRFQGANKSDFSDAVDIFVINDTLGAHSNDLFPVSTEKYQYVRYVGPEDSRCNVSEIAFYSDNNLKLEGKIIGTDSVSSDNKENTLDRVFDGNPLTFFTYKYGNGGWVGLDLGFKQAITKITMVPRCGLNGICLGNVYELFYWDNKWISLGQQIATEHILNYHNVPSNSLLWLRNHTTGKEERPFTYENGKQVWW